MSGQFEVVYTLGSGMSGIVPSAPNTAGPVTDYQTLVHLCSSYILRKDTHREDNIHATHIETQPTDKLYT